MGTYTTNKNLFMPSVGETGWGELVNNNFSTIDTFLKPISLSGSTYTFTGNQTGGSISATSITNSGTLTNAGKITGNGGIVGTTGTFSGTVSCTKLTETNPGTWTVTPTNTYNTAVGSINTMYSSKWFVVLPPSNKKYSGTIRFYSRYANEQLNYISSWTQTSSTIIKTYEIISGSGFINITLNNAPFLYVYGQTNAANICLCQFTIS